jgi:MFS family permease
VTAVAEAPAREHVARPLSIRPFLGCVFAIDVLAMLVVVAYGGAYLIRVLDAPPSYPAYALGVYGFVKLLVAPIGGRFLDRAPARVGVVFAVALNLTGLGFMLGWHAAMGYMIGVAFLSAGIAFSWLVVFHVLGVATEPKTRARLTSLMSIVSAMATAVGFAGGGLLGEQWQVAFSVGIMAAVVAGSLLYVVADIPVVRPSAGGLRERHAGPEHVAERVKAVPGRLQAVAAADGLVHSAAIAGVGAIFSPFVLHTLDLTLLEGSLLLLPAIGVGALSMFVAGHRSRPGRRLRELAVCYAVGAATLLALSFVDSWWAFGIVALGLGVAIGGATPLMGATILDVSHGGEQKASVLGWLFFAQGIGSVAGPVLVGLVISLLGVREAVGFLSAWEAGVVGLLLVTSRLEPL